MNHHIKLYQLKEALLDPQVWLLTLFVLLNEIINGGISNFGKLIVKGIVEDPLKTTALGIPQGAFQVFWILTGTYLSSRFQNARTYVMMVYMIPTIIGTSLMWKLDRSGEHKTALLIGYYISGGFVSALVVALQMPASNLGGYTKRVTGTAVVFAAYCVGNIIGPHAFLEEESPTYPTGCLTVLSCAMGQVVVAAALRVLLVWRNRRRDQAAVRDPALDGTAAHEAATDLTDLEVSETKHTFLLPREIGWLTVPRGAESRVPLYALGGVWHHVSRHKFAECVVQFIFSGYSAFMAPPELL